MDGSKQILVLHSYHQGLRWTDDIMDGIQSIFKKYSSDINLNVEYMDTKRHFDGFEGTHLNRLLDMYRHKHLTHKPDIIISSDDNAFQFLLAHHDELFPGTPIVFCGVNDFDDKMLAGHELVTGVVEFLDQKATIDVALKLHPKTTQVAIITDTSTTGQGNRKILEALASEYSGRAEFVFLDADNTGLTLKELLDKLLRLPEDSIVYYSDFLRSRGEYIIQETAVPQISKASKRPVYAHYDEILGMGVVGGRLVNGRSHGQTAARMALRILGGTPASELPVHKESINDFMFDYQQIKRFGIDESRLPEASTIINRPRSFYRDHWKLIWASLATMAFLAGMVIVLAINVLLRKRAEMKLREARDKLEIRVTERTAELQTANMLLNEEIDERKKTEASLVESQNELHAMYDAITDFITVLSTDYRIISVNRVVEEQFGKDLVGKVCYEAYQARDEICPDCPTKIAIETKKPAFTFQPATSVSNPVEIYAFPIIDEDGEVVAVVEHGKDISKRLEAEGELQKNREFTRNILDTVDEGFIIIDRDFRILSTNKAYCEQTKMPAEEIVGKHCYEVSHNSIKPCYENGEECAVHNTFESGEPYVCSHQHISKDGSTIYVETKSFPIKDESGNVISVIEVVNNISDKHLLEEQILRTQKLEAVGVLAGGIAHDFNNLLQSVLGSISLAKMLSEKDEKVYQTLLNAEKALNLSTNLTKQLLTFSKGGEPVKKTFTLPSVVHDSVSFALSGSNINYDIIAQEDLWPVNADEGQIAQVIQNIVLNASDAMPDGGTVRINLGNVSTDDTSKLSLKEGKYVSIAIEDSGIGIPESHIQKIFDPYFSTKQKGSGLGLATSHSIINKHNGLLSVTSKLDSGSTFFIYLPASMEKILPEMPEVAGILSAGGKVLIMDDDETVRIIAGKMLEALGWEVEYAAHGEDAVEKYSAAMGKGAAFDAVILDLTIRGGIGGIETVRKLTEIDPSVRAIVSSGYSDAPTMADFEDYGFKATLNKPYNIEDLSKALKSAIDQPT